MTNPSVSSSLTATDDTRFDFGLLWRVFRRNLKWWIPLFLIVYLISLAVGLFWFPLTYTATVSISMQQPNQVPTSLAALAGNPAARKYIGVLRSRRFTEEVDAKVGFRELLGLPPGEKSQAEAIDRVIKDLKVEDNTSDGLIYVTVSLPGPSRFGPDQQGRRQKIKQAVSDASNGYAASLQKYLRENDTDKELTLLRSADVELKKAQLAYQNAINRLANFVKTMRTPVFSASTSGGTAGNTDRGSDANSAASQLVSLYLRRGQLELQIKSLEVSILETKKLLKESGGSIAKIPTEDPLLFSARREVLAASEELKNLLISYNDAMPEVRQARERLRIADERLATQVKAILDGKTSDLVKQQALLTEFGTVKKQIADTESGFFRSRVAGTEMEKLRNDVTLKLEVLKTVMTRYAEMKLQTVSAQNRMLVVDPARPPLYPKQGILFISAFCLIPPLLVVLVLAFIGYQRALGSRQ